MATSLMQQTGEAMDRTYNPRFTRQAVLSTTSRRLLFPKSLETTISAMVSKQLHQIMEHSINYKTNSVDPGLSISKEAG